MTPNTFNHSPILWRALGHTERAMEGFSGVCRADGESSQQTKGSRVHRRATVRHMTHGKANRSNEGSRG